MSSDYSHRSLPAGVEALVLDCTLYPQGSASPLHALAEDVSLEVQRVLTEPARAALENQLLTMPVMGSSARLGDRVTITELREVVRRFACAIDHSRDWEDWK
jgi:hypothetical protein